MTGIYKITSPSGKIYIGSTINFEKRIESYRYKSCKDQRRLYYSINKYGYENHLIEFIEECSEEELNSRERHWQEFYEVCGKNGLNCLYVETDKKKRKLSEETKERIRQSLIGRKYPKRKKVSEETRNRMRLSQLKRTDFDNNKRQSKMMINNELSPLKKKIINTITGEIYRSINNASIENNINYSTLKAMLSGRFKNKTNLIYLENDSRKAGL